jgi:hypothetical protein
MSGLKNMDFMLQLELVTWKGARPFGFGSLVVPAALAKGLTRRDFEHGPFFNTLTEHGLRIARYRLVIESSIIPPVLAAALGARSGLTAISPDPHRLCPQRSRDRQVGIRALGDVGYYVLESDFNSTNASMSVDLADKPA